jgi:hypothetical protein
MPDRPLLIEGDLGVGIIEEALEPNLRILCYLL